ncbi:Glucose-1-phosphatase (plasmid) [Asticcacaulis sp. MM231]|uniref:histidine-type phosphatase n=1 Tax=Asticcacaulis sp. MM231 TaxID=3157666 RepID=UPI0032D577CA
MTIHHWLRFALTFAGAYLLAVQVSAQPVSSDEKIERVVMLMRHGVRSPIADEVPLDTKTGAPWPAWSVPPETITNHGADVLKALGTTDRTWLSAIGILPTKACPDPATMVVWTNTAPRTIATGQAYLQGLAPGCALKAGHLPDDQIDPLFEPTRAPPPWFDAQRAVASINAYTGGMSVLVQRHAAALGRLEHVLACDTRPCSPQRAPRLAATADNRGLVFEGPVRDASGTAQVLMLEYLEGFPLKEVGWGRANPATLKAVGEVHAALFDVFSRPPYMMAFQTEPTARRIIDDFSRPDAPAFDMLIGHDTNVAALAALLGVAVEAPGFALNDPSPGGALVLALIRDAHGRAFVRVYYRSQTADDIRAMRAHATWKPLAMKACKEGPNQMCPLPKFITLLKARTAEASAPHSAVDHANDDEPHGAPS